MQQKRATIKATPPAGSVPLRGPSGRLYGYLDPATRVIEFKAPGKAPEQVHLDDYLKQTPRP